MTIVYRVETAAGHGPYYYSGPESHEWEVVIADHREGDDQHPAFQLDDLTNWKDGMIFGFISIDAMCAWFNGTERLFLATCGHCLSAYETTRKVSHGNKQLAFWRNSSKLLWQKPLNHF